MSKALIHHLLDDLVIAVTFFIQYPIHIQLYSIYGHNSTKIEIHSLMCAYRCLDVLSTHFQVTHLKSQGVEEQMS